jgi:hypothetical protein
VNQFVEKIGLNLDGIGGASSMAATLTLKPTISFDPRFSIYLLGGAIVLITAMAQLVRKPNDFKNSLNHFAGVATAGCVLVYLATYVSALATAVVAATTFIVCLLAAMILHSNIQGNYPDFPKYWRIFYPAVILALLFPFTVYLNAIGQPQLSVSPSNVYPQLAKAGQTNAQNATVTAANSDAFSVVVTADASAANGSLTVYLNNTIGGPVEIPRVLKGQQVPLSVRIESSPSIKNGTYPVVINYKYQDAAQKQYSGSNVMQVTVGGTGVGQQSIAIPLYVVAVGAIVLATLSGIVLLFRRRTQAVPPYFEKQPDTKEESTRT